MTFKKIKINEKKKKEKKRNYTLLRVSTKFIPALEKRRIRLYLLKSIS